MAKANKTIYEKVMVVKATCGAIIKDMVNEFHHSRYYDVNKVLQQIEPLLQEQRLLLLQPIEGDKVYTRIIDLDAPADAPKDLRMLEGYMDLPEYDNPQKTGSAVTYFRRYGIVSLLGIESDVPDDDGNMAIPSKKTAPKVSVWLTEEQFNITQNATTKQIQAVLKTYDGMSGKGMKKDYRKKLQEIIKSRETHPKTENQYY